MTCKNQKENIQIMDKNVYLMWNLEQYYKTDDYLVHLGKWTISHWSYLLLCCFILKKEGCFFLYFVAKIYYIFISTSWFITSPIIYKLYHVYVALTIIRDDSGWKIK